MSIFTAQVGRWRSLLEFPTKWFHSF